MAKQISISQYFKKPKLDTQETKPSSESRPSTNEVRPHAVDPKPHELESVKHTEDSSGTSMASTSTPPPDLSNLDEPAMQPKLQRFPCNTISGKQRCFSTRWYEKFLWLEYSTTKDAVYCKSCRHFPEQSDTKFTQDGFKDWKHLSQACLKHQDSKGHLHSQAKLAAYRQCHQPDSRGTVFDQLNKDKVNESFVERNRKHIKVVLDIVLFCAKQDISLRGHRESEEALNRGNFLELFRLLSNYDPEIQNRFDQLPKNATMMSSDIQNDLLESAASLLLRKIRAELHATPTTYYAIMADEYKDLSKKELVAVCIRYLHEGLLKERAIGFLDTCDMTAAAISEKILEVLAPLNLDPDLCVGFCFDGASVMSGAKGGVQSILKRTFPLAIYVHCSSHRLNLVLSSVAKVSRHINTFFETLNSIHGFMTGSNRHARFMSIQKELNPGRQCLELERSVDTRWGSKSGSVTKVLTLLDAILETFAEYSETSSGLTKLEADSLLQQMQTKKFLFLLVTFGKLFEMSDFATKGLQSPAVSVTDCIHLIEGLKSNLKMFRDNTQQDFEKVLKLTQDLMVKHDIHKWDLAASRERKLPSKLSASVITSSLGKSDSIKTDDDLRHLWNEVLDRQIMELNSRFHDDVYDFMRAAVVFSPGSSTFGDRESITVACKHYSIDIGDAELTVFIQQLKRKADDGQGFASLMEVLDNTPEDIFPNVNKTIRALITLPMTSCSVERLFSTTNRIKTSMRSSMITARLNNLSLLSFERELADTLNYDEIISIFMQKPRRLRL